MVPLHRPAAYMDLLFNSHHFTDIFVLNISHDALVSGPCFPTMKHGLQGWNARLSILLPFKHSQDDFFGSSNQQPQQPSPPSMLTIFTNPIKKTNQNGKTHI